MLRGDRGEVSAARAKQLLDRATISDRYTAVGRRLQDGEARGENVDAIARRTTGLNSAELERLEAMGEEIAEQVVNLPPETFDKYLSRTIRGMRDPIDAGPSKAEQQRAASVQRLSCNADLYAILIDRFGQPTGAGPTHRAATREQRRQLRALYETCAIDEATPFDRCEIHHVNVFYEDGGETELDNLLPVSTEWHHRIHDRG